MKLGFEDLIIRNKSIILVEKIYLLVNKFPSNEMYGLSSQLKRAIVSVPSNIAEGYGKTSNKEFKKFLEISRGSIYEVKTQIDIALKLNFISNDDYNEIMLLIKEEIKVLNSFISKMRL